MAAFRPARHAARETRALAILEIPAILAILAILAHPAACPFPGTQTIPTRHMTRIIPTTLARARVHACRRSPPHSMVAPWAGRRKPGPPRVGRRFRRIGIAIFHDGNPGHLWRGEIASRLGESIAGVGVIIWLATLYQSPVAVAFALLALGLPFLLVGTFGARLENASQPGTALKWLNRLRILLALGLVAMHFRTILPVLYAILFLLSLCGRLHDAARTGAVRACLAPGEPEHVANDIYVGGAVAAVLGPILATFFYILIGERILLIGVIAAVAFLISSNSEGFLDALPPGRRAFMLATPETLYPNGSVPPLALSPDDEAALDEEERREESLPPWYQQGPTTVGQAFGELRAGLGLAGTVSPAAAALWAISALAVVSGAFSALAVFYVTDVLGLSPFYLGPLLAAEAAGMALGLFLAITPEVARGAKFWLMIGLLGTGVGLVALVVMPQILFALLIMLGIGFMTTLAISGARRALYAGFDPVEQRSITAAENWAAALGNVIGVLLVALFLSEPAASPNAPQLSAKLASHGWPAGQLLMLLGLALIVGAVILIALSIIGKQQANAGKKGQQGKLGKRGASDDELGSSYHTAFGAAAGADDEWGDNAEDDGWGDGQDDFAASAQYDQYGNTGYGTGYQTGYSPSVEMDAYDDEGDDQPSARYPRRPGNQRRPRW